MLMMVDYWLASEFGRLWLRIHKGLRSSLGGMPAECHFLARGQGLPAWRLHQAQGFAARVWWRVGMALVLCIFPVIGIGAAIRPAQTGRDVLGAFIFTLGCLAGIAMLQMGLVSFRSSQVRSFLRQADPAAAAGPLPEGSLGAPTRWDFWVVLVIAIGVFGILLSAATR